MNKLLKHIALTSLAISSVFGSLTIGKGNGDIKEIPYERPKGFEHRVRSEEEKIRKKEHKAKIKARRNRRSKNRR